MDRHPKFYIDGAWVDPVGDQRMTVIDPATEQPFAAGIRIFIEAGPRGNRSSRKVGSIGLFRASPYSTGSRRGGVKLRQVTG